jgi:hypothetical protein
MAEYAGIMGLQNKDKMILVDDVETEIDPSIIEL